MDIEQTGCGLSNDGQKNLVGPRSTIFTAREKSLTGSTVGNQAPLSSLFLNLPESEKSVKHLAS
jgi:hypothetical protein